MWEKPRSKSRKTPGVDFSDYALKIESILPEKAKRFNEFSFCHFKNFHPGREGVKSKGILIDADKIKTAAEYERHKENFFKELEVVLADVVMAIIADFMLVYLPAPIVSLRPPLARNAGRLSKFFYSCPDNEFQGPGVGKCYRAKKFRVVASSTQVEHVLFGFVNFTKKFEDYVCIFVNFTKNFVDYDEIMVELFQLYFL